MLRAVLAVAVLVVQELVKEETQPCGGERMLLMFDRWVGGVCGWVGGWVVGPVHLTGQAGLWAAGCCILPMSTCSSCRPQQLCAGLVCVVAMAAPVARGRVPWAPAVRSTARRGGTSPPPPVGRLRLQVAQAAALLLQREEGSL